jgi:hypothetical protein
MMRQQALLGRRGTGRSSLPAPRRARCTRVAAQAKGFGFMKSKVAPKDLLGCASRARGGGGGGAQRPPRRCCCAAEAAGGAPAPGAAPASPLPGATVEGTRPPAPQRPPLPMPPRSPPLPRRPSSGREPLKPLPLSPMREVPAGIPLPPYAKSGVLPGLNDKFEIHDAAVGALGPGCLVLRLQQRAVGGTGGIAHTAAGSSSTPATENRPPAPAATPGHRQDARVVQARGAGAQARRRARCAGRDDR